MLGRFLVWVAFGVLLATGAEVMGACPEVAADPAFVQPDARDVLALRQARQVLAVANALLRLASLDETSPEVLSRGARDTATTLTTPRERAAEAAVPGQTHQTKQPQAEK
jgi:hypothetical protein